MTVRLRPDLNDRLRRVRAEYGSLVVDGFLVALLEVAVEAARYHRDTGHEDSTATLYGTCDSICETLAVLDGVTP